MRRRRWTLKELALAASLFVSAASGIGIIARTLSAGDRAVRRYIVGVVRDSLDCYKERP